MPAGTRKLKLSNFVLPIVISLAFGSLQVRAQSFTATISGIVTDQSAAVISGAPVVVTNTETNVTWSATTDVAGRYVVPSLPPGAYRIAVEMSGFKRLVRSDIQLEVDQRLRLDLSMEVGAITEQITVSGQAPLVESERASLGSVISNRQLVDIPLNGRGVLQLASLVPGVVSSPAFDSTVWNRSSQILINGGRGQSSAFLTDGVSSVTSAAQAINVVPVSPAVDAIQEFKVQTNSLSAEFGRTGGGVVNMIFKSGTNEFHGSVFEFLRNSRLDANDFFSNRRGLELASFRRNQFGASLGGPIVRDRLFFFVNYEGLRQSVQETSTFTFPTTEERAGNFSGTSARSGGECQPVEIFDPFSLTSINGSFNREQFPNNVIPGSVLDPIAQNAVALYPLPNTPGDPCTGSNNFISSRPSKQNLDQIHAKVDLSLTSKDSMFVRISRKTDDILGADHYQNIAAPIGDRLGRKTPGMNGALSYTRTISPTLLLETRMGFTRFGVLNEPPSGPDFDLRETLGFQGEFVDQMTPSPSPSFPRFSLSGYGNLGRNGSVDQDGNAYQWIANVTKIKGAHTLKSGVEFRVYQQAGPNGGNDYGTFNFNSNFTQGPSPTRGGPTSGDALASLLAGMGTGSIRIPPRVFTSSNYFALYVQDDFRVTNKLVLNLGLRYDLETGRKDRYDHLSWFDMDAPSPVADQVGLPDLRGGLRFVNIDGNSKRQFPLDKNNFGPRFGLAYSLDDKTVLRSGYGINYTPYVGRATSGSSGYIGFSADTDWVSSVDGITPLNTLSDPYPRGLVIPRGAADGLLTALGSNLSGGSGANSAFIRPQAVGYVQQWNFSLQREMPAQMAFEAAYIGNKGTKLVASGGFEENQLPPAALALGDGLLERIPNPFFGVIEVGPLAEPTTTVGHMLRRFPHFTGLETFRPAAASSIYHALQAGIKKRFSHGVQFSVAYTFGKMIDDSSHVTGSQGGGGFFQNYYDRGADRSVSLYDTPQSLVISYVAELPFGRGKRVGSGWNRITDAFLGGWQVNGVSTFRSGFAFPISNRSNNSGSFSAVQRPNVNGDPKLDSDRPIDDKLLEWFDTSVFSQPAPYTFGNAPRVLPTVRSDGIVNFDLSLFKTVPVSADGTVRIQFRAEAFNLTNSPVFSTPARNFGAGSFGTVSGQANASRQIQFGLKILF